MSDEAPDRADLIRLAAATEVLLTIAEEVDGEIVDEATHEDPSLEHIVERRSKYVIVEKEGLAATAADAAP